jgi:23S rRNA pseudouridine1911/1915/1917 synthase
VQFSVVPPQVERLDRFLADQLQLSRTVAARIVAAGHIRCGERVLRSSHLLARGDVITVDLPEHEEPRRIVPNPIALDVIHEDEDLAVIDKPAGLVVHPAPGHWDDTLVNALVARGTTLAGGAEGRPGIVHRLDRDTSGLLIVSKTDLAHRRLGTMIASRKISRVYAAMVWGHLDEEKVTIDAPLARHPKDRKRMSIQADGRAAKTDAYPIVRLGPVSIVRLELHTGRTHQIRVHLESIGHPIVGDAIYPGGGSKRISGVGKQQAKMLEALAPRQALHAALLAFRHPISGVPLELRSPWPADLWPLLKAALGEDLDFTREEALSALHFFGTDG